MTQFALNQLIKVACEGENLPDLVAEGITLSEYLADNDDDCALELAIVTAYDPEYDALTVITADNTELELSAAYAMPLDRSELIALIWLTNLL